MRRSRSTTALSAPATATLAATSCAAAAGMDTARSASRSPTTSAWAAFVLRIPPLIAISAPGPGYVARCRESRVVCFAEDALPALEVAVEELGAAPHRVP